MIMIMIMIMKIFYEHNENDEENEVFFIIPSGAQRRRSFARPRVGASRVG